MNTLQRLFQLALCGLMAIAVGSVSAEDKRPDSRQNTKEFRADQLAELSRGPEMFLQLPIIAVIDVDHDGKLSLKEVENASVELKKLDRNGDGQIDLHEMVLPLGPARSADRGVASQGRSGADATALIDRLMRRDKDGDGFLTYDEMPGILSRIVKRDDEDRDGKLSREEVMKSVQALIRKREGNSGRAGDQRPQPPLPKE